MADLLHVITSPLAYPFMERGLIAAMLIGVICGVIGTYVVLRGMVFLTDALSHAILPGVAVGYLVHGTTRGPLFWWALGSALISAFGIGAVSRRTRIKEDTAIGIIFAGMFALGIALISSVRSYATDLTHFLFGNVLGVSHHDLAMIGVFGGLILVVVLLFYKEFLIISFDPILAATLRLPVRGFYYLQLTLIAVTVVVSLQTVGVALMIAMLVTPAATAFLLTRKLPIMMMLSALIGMMSGLLGIYISFYFNIASGAAIVLVSTVIFLMTILVSPRRRILWMNGK